MLRVPTNLKTALTLSVSGALAIALIIFLALVPPPSERVLASHSGYTLRYPSHWIVASEKHDSHDVVSIREPRGRATITVSVQSEPRLLERGGRVALASEIEARLLRSEAYDVDFFMWHNPDIGAENNGYITRGSFVRDSVNYDFKELSVLDAQERTTFRSDVISAFTPELGPFVDTAFFSIESRRAIQNMLELLTAEQALNRVRALPSIILYSAEGLEEGRDFSLRAEEGNDAWLVRMFVPLEREEDVKEISVQRWSVDKTTGIVSRVVL